MDRKFRRARIWSNEELKKYAYFFNGSIVNVSGWKDRDKTGGVYRDYFYNAKSYCITNYGGEHGDSEGELDIPEIQLDLTSQISDELKMRFNTVFNHTTLEHIYENRLAFRNMCSMATDAVIVIVPFAQQVHTGGDSFKDFWRYSPYAMECMYEENGFDMVVCNHNNDYDTSVYLFCIGIRKEKMKDYPDFNKIEIDNNQLPGEWIGTSGKLIMFMQKILKAMKKNR